MQACIDSVLSVLSPSKINPTWLIVLYANNLFILDCVSPKTDPTTKDKKLLNTNITLQESVNDIICANKSINSANIDIFGTIAMYVVTIVGTPSYTSGAQK